MTSSPLPRPAPLCSALPTHSCVVPTVRLARAYLSHPALPVRLCVCVCALRCLHPHSRDIGPRPAPPRRRAPGERVRQGRAARRSLRTHARVEGREGGGGSRGRVAVPWAVGRSELINFFGEARREWRAESGGRQCGRERVWTDIVLLESSLDSIRAIHSST